MGIDSTLVVDQHFLALELVQLELDLVRDRWGQALRRDVWVAAAVVLIRGPGLVHGQLCRELDRASAALAFTDARVRGRHGPRDGPRGARG